MSILLYGCTTWTVTIRMEKKLDGNYTRILWAVLNNSWRQHPSKQQLYGRLPPITKTIQVRRTRRAGHSWRSKDQLISDIHQCTSSHGWEKLGRPVRTCIQQLSADRGARERLTIETGGEKGLGDSCLQRNVMIKFQVAKGHRNKIWNF